MIFNKRVRLYIRRINGTTRVHWSTFRGSYESAWCLGFNIIPRMFGFYIQLAISDTQKRLEHKLAQKEDMIANQQELMRTILEWE